jgi:hypothetical protein
MSQIYEHLLKYNNFLPKVYIWFSNAPFHFTPTLLAACFSPTQKSQSITILVARPSVAHRDAPRDNFGWQSIRMCPARVSVA